MALFDLLAGGLILLFGRRLFWLFVAASGFVLGARVAAELAGRESDVLMVVIGLCLGVIGAVASIFLQRIVVAGAGFVAGGYLIFTLANELHQEAIAWIGFAVGGVVGAILVSVLFDWTLIGLSALFGSALVAQSLPVRPSTSALLFVAFTMLGCVIQAKQLSRRPRADKSGPSQPKP